MRFHIPETIIAGVAIWAGVPQDFVFAVLALAFAVRGYVKDAHRVGAEL